ncbi:MAG: SH3 domain-containing protein [Chloroflexota bacterium]
MINSTSVEATISPLTGIPAYTKTEGWGQIDTLATSGMNTPATPTPTVRHTSPTRTRRIPTSSSTPTPSLTPFVWAAPDNIGLIFGANGVYRTWFQGVVTTFCTTNCLEISVSEDGIITYLLENGSYLMATDPFAKKAYKVLNEYDLMGYYQLKEGQEVAIFAGTWIPGTHQQVMNVLVKGDKTYYDLLKVNIDTGQYTSLIQSDEEIHAFPSPDGQKLALVMSIGLVKVITVQGQEIREFTLADYAYTSIKVGKDDWRQIYIAWHHSSPYFLVFRVVNKWDPETKTYADVYAALWHVDVANPELDEFLDHMSESSLWLESFSPELTYMAVRKISMTHEYDNLVRPVEQGWLGAKPITCFFGWFPQTSQAIIGDGDCRIAAGFRILDASFRNYRIELSLKGNPEGEPSQVRMIDRDHALIELKQNENLIVYLYNRRDKSWVELYSRKWTEYDSFGLQYFRYSLFSTLSPVPSGPVPTPTSTPMSTPAPTYTPTPSLPPTITPSLTPNLTLTSNAPCKNALAPQLVVGKWAHVRPDTDTPNRLRDAPGFDGKPIGYALPGESVEVLDGPICKEGMWWWKVATSENNLVGWTAEGDNEEYWLLPLEE